jgi:flagellar hook-length control protein FliK
MADAESATAFSRLLQGEPTDARTDPKRTDPERRQPESAAASRGEANPRTGAEPSGREAGPQVTTAQETISGMSLTGAGGPLTDLTSWSGLVSLLPPGDLLTSVPTNSGGLTAASGLTAEMLAQISAEIVTGYSEKNGTQNLTLNLKPAHLGRLEIQLIARGDQLSVRLTAANPAAEAALKDNLQELTEALQVRAGRHQHLDVRVVLKEDLEPEPDPRDRTGHGFQNQDQPREQETGNHGSSDTSEDPESGPRTQRG